MKRGVHFVPTSSELTPDEQMNKFSARYGMPVVADPFTKELAHAAGVWPCKRIVVGPLWGRFSPGEREAILLHEYHHGRRLHLEARLLVLLVLALPLLYVLPWRMLLALAATGLLFLLAQWIGYRQEYAADRFAVDHGYGVECMQFIQRGGPQGDDPFHPSHAARLKRIKERLHAVAL